MKIEFAVMFIIILLLSMAVDKPENPYEFKITYMYDVGEQQCRCHDGLQGVEIVGKDIVAHCEDGHTKATLDRWDTLQ